ncbi:MAG: aldo/keto reductase [Bryobacteraceae bacterium]|nr:aldo/keto reductase [Bryobacteraceae bacterium]
MDRRSFVQFAALALPLPAQQPSANGLPTRRLGRTNEHVSILALGGAHIGRVGQKDRPLAIRMMHSAIDGGLRFFDNAWDYHDGWGEEMMGLGLEGGWRDKVFLMTKNCERTYEGSRRCLEDSLRRLKTDHVDLWQFHEMNYDNDPDWVFDKGGLKYALEAMKAGKVRYIGFTGHKDPKIHLKMLAKPYPWATAQMPINVMDAFYRSFQNEVVPVCVKNNVGVIGMKCLGGGPFEARIPAQTSITAEQCVRFSLSLPISTLCRGYTTMAQLEQDLRIARDFKPLTPAERAAILELARPEAGDGRHELFKSTQTFDGAPHRTQHGFVL